MTHAIKSQRVVVGDQLRAAAVVMQGERIVDVLAPEAVPAAVDVVDVGDAVVMPGLVDTHVHINEPGRTAWEGFVTATRAALAGGVTTLVDMPLNCIPATVDAAALATKLAACQGELAVDVGFWGGTIPGNAPQLQGLADAGVLGCKAFMIESGVEEFPWSTAADLRLAMVQLQRLGLPLLAHAELELEADVQEPDPRKYAGYLQSRPAAWEDAAIALLIELCRETRCHVHVVHLSSADSIAQIRAAKAEGLPITAETCAHYLCLSAEQIPDGETCFKCAPPIREHANRERLWQGLREGVIDFVVTDHSPCTPHLKKPELGDFHQAWGGIASLQLGLTSVWAQAHNRGVDLPTLSRWLSTAPARFAGLSARKGEIAVGRDADLVVWDPDACCEVGAEDLHFKHKVSPYIGQTLRGQVLQTWLRGACAYTCDSPDNKGFVTPPRGRPVLGRDAGPASDPAHSGSTPNSGITR